MVKNICPVSQTEDLKISIKIMDDKTLVKYYLYSINNQNDTLKNRYFKEIYRRYAGKVFAKCISMLNDHGLARDATQEVFIKITLNLGKFKSGSKLSTRIYSITYNYCVDLIRKKKKHKIVYLDDLSKISSGSDRMKNAISDSEILDNRMILTESILELIPKEDKRILILKYKDDRSIKEIAEIMNKTESAIKMQLVRAKSKVNAMGKEKYGATWYNPAEREEGRDYSNIIGEAILN